jgi:hypothetical protein
VSRNQDDGAGACVRLGKLPGEVEAALRADRDVHEDDVGLQLLGLPQRIRDIGRDADNRHALSLKEAGGRFQKGSVVVDNKTPERHVSRVPCAAGQAHCR